MEALGRATYPRELVCPLCRDSALTIVALSAVPVRAAVLSLCPFSEFAGLIAVNIGGHEYTREKM
jgi:hypothetical protein